MKKPAQGGLSRHCHVIVSRALLQLCHSLTREANEEVRYAPNSPNYGCACYRHCSVRFAGEPIDRDCKELRDDGFNLFIRPLIKKARARLGANENTAELADLGAVVIDMTDVKANDSANHGKFAELAELGPELGSVLAGGIGDGPSSSSETQGSGGAIGAIVTSPVKLLGGSVRLIRSSNPYR